MPEEKTVQTPLNEDTGLIRWAALVAMLIDHIGAVFFTDTILFRVIGRIAFPLFCFGIMMGSLYTRSIAEYALRLLVFALLSQVPYMLGLNHPWNHLNVIFTLLLGLMSIWAARAKWHYSHIWGTLLCLAVSAAVRMDYGWKGVLLIWMMYQCRQSRGAFASMMILFCLYWGTASTDLSAAAGLDRVNAGNPMLLRLIQLPRAFLKLQTFALLSLPFMLVTPKRTLNMPKWLHYAGYPGHLLILYLLRTLLSF